MAIKLVSVDKLSLFLDKVKGLIPKKTSELTNDSGYITQKDVPEGAAASSTVPKMDGVAAAGTESAFARGDHVHPSDDTKVDKVSGKQLSTNDYTNEEKTKLAGIAAGANKYVLPTATDAVLGGIKIGVSLEIDSEGKVNVKSVDWAKINGAPANLSDFTNDEGFIKNTVSNLTNYYKKAETYTQEEINAKIAAIKTIQIKSVNELPATGESNVIYLIPKQSGNSAQNVKDEYIWTGTDFEKIGDTKIDLSGYWSKEELIECTDEDINALF